ncbi:MAG: CDP-alcohol phosphatidyltransferase family protein, partial [Vicinamibacterales bacterium]
MPRPVSRAPLGARAIAAQAAGLAATYALAAAVGPSIHALPTFPLLAAGVFCGVALIAISYLHNHPFAQFGPANLVTTVRVVAVSLVVALIGESRTPAAAWTAAIGGCVSTLLDGVDGWLARRSGLASEFGARYDMEIDALLILALCGLAWQHEKAGA